MKNKIKSGLLLTLFALFAQSCILAKPKNYNPDWEPPVTSHSLVFPEPAVMQLLWTQQVYVLNDKNIQCLSTRDVILLVGSQNSSDIPKVFALDGNNGSLLWEFDDVGVLAYSDENVFIGSGTIVYLVDPKTGAIKWQKQLPGIRHITNMGYYDNLLFINGSGTYFFYVLNNDGEIISRYSQVSVFRSEYGNVPFYETLPFGVVVEDDIQIVQTGDGLYSADVYGRNSNTKLWQIDRNSISNFIAFNNHILWIASDGVVKIADKYNGRIVESINIEPGIDFFNPNINVQYFGYYLCGDSQSSNLYVILGDSRQIFAINFEK
jgi:outer membrane protein assembly factor BamB